MSPMNTLSVLALAAGALAVPYNGHNHGHARLHHVPRGMSNAPYGAANATSAYSSGTGLSSAVPTTTTATLNYVSTSVSPATDSASTESATVDLAASSDSGCSASTVTVTTKAYVTVTVPASGASDVSSTGSAASSVVASVSSDAMGTSYVTSIFHATQTVTLPASMSPSASANSTWSSSAPLNESATLSYTTSAETTSSTDVAPVQSSYSSAEASVYSSSSAAYSLPVTSSAVAYSAMWSSSASTESSLTTSSVEVAPVASSATTSSAAATSSASSYSGSTGKRGVAYNDASLTQCFLNKSAVSWAYNWGSSCSGLNSAFKFIPTLWGTASEFTSAWSTNADTAISSGSTHLFSFNEPDMSTQSNLSPADAASAWKTYMEPFAGKAKLCAPSVTNGGGAMGLDWLAAFLDACSGCTIDCVNIHWYDSAENVDYFKSHVQNATDVAGGKSVFLSEFGATGSDSEISTFLDEVMPWMDSQSYVDGYAYYMVSDGRLVTGTELSTIGAVYAESA